MSYRTLFAAVLALVIAAPMVRAQQAGGTAGGTTGGATGGDNSGGRGDRGNRGNRGAGGFDPARIMDMFKERMAPTDEEWKVIEPKLQKVMDDRRDTGGMFGRGGSRRGGDNGGGASSDTAKSPMQTATQDLRDVLDKKDATAEEINAKLTAYREARDKARQTLVAAQKDLKDVLTQRQEAVLVSMGMLD